MKQRRRNLVCSPKSLILYTPAALELALLCPFFSSVGDDDKPETAESTLVKSDGAASTDMVGGVQIDSLEGQKLIYRIDRSTYNEYCVCNREVGDFVSSSSQGR